MSLEKQCKEQRSDSAAGCCVTSHNVLPQIAVHSEEPVPAAGYISFMNRQYYYRNNHACINKTEKVIFWKHLKPHISIQLAIQSLNVHPFIW